MPKRRSVSRKVLHQSAAEATRSVGHGVERLDASERPAASKLAPGLYVTATPIGNLGDASERMRSTLAAVDRILCEDTRVTGAMLAQFGIATPMLPYHDHNAARVRPQVLDMLHRGERVALVSDAGTPLISDPGYHLVRAVRAAGHRVFTVPGPSAIIAALAIAGLPTDRFLFADSCRARPRPVAAR